MTISKQAKCIAFLAMMNFIWSGSYTVTKFGLGTMDPLVIIFLRFGLAFLILAGWSLAKRHSFKASRGDILRIAGAGLFVGLAHALAVLGLDISHASDASLLYTLEPIFGIVLASVFLRERFLATTGIGLFLVMFGIAILSGFDSAAFGLGGQGANLGNLLIVAGIFCEGFFSIVIQPVAGRLRSSVMMAGVLLVASVVLLAAIAAKGENLTKVDASDTAVIAYLSILCTVVGYTAWVSIMKYVPVGIMFFTLFIQPVAGPLIAAVVLGESIDTRFVVAGAFLISGMAVAVTGQMRSSLRGVGSVVA